MEEIKKRTKPSQMQVREKRLYSIEEASVYLGRSVWAVREMIWAAKIPHIRDGRRTLLDIKDMDAWIDSNKTLPLV